MKVEFDNSLVTGNEMIDGQHKELITKICRLASDLEISPRLDLKKDYFADRGGKPLGSDKGRFNASGKEEDMHRFKVPNLRNVELTHPYLHDGTVTALDEAVRIMGIYCSGLDVPQKDRALIVGFLRTLTGQHEGRPVQGEAVAR